MPELELEVSPPRYGVYGIFERKDKAEEWDIHRDKYNRPVLFDRLTKAKEYVEKHAKEGG